MEQTASTPKASILIVDDDRGSCSAMERLLQRSGYLVLCAHTCDAAMRLARTMRFDLVLADAGLPDGDRLALLKRIEALYPIEGIAVSGYTDLSDRARAAGFASCLVKPINFTALIEEIERVLCRRVTA